MSARALAALLALGLATAAPAEEFDAGGFVVHYTALSTMQLTPSVADAYGIARSPHRGLLNVAVLRTAPGKALGVPVPAQVVVTAVNTLGQLKPIAMRRVDEPPAIYFLGEVTVADRETVAFELQVIPEGSKAPIRLRLQHQYFAQ
jgi:hypothetical protein